MIATNRFGYDEERGMIVDIDPTTATSTDLRSEVETSIDFILEKSARMDDLLKKLRATHSH